MWPTITETIEIIEELRCCNYRIICFFSKINKTLLVCLASASMHVTCNTPRTYQRQKPFSQFNFSGIFAIVQRCIGNFTFLAPAYGCLNCNGRCSSTSFKH